MEEKKWVSESKSRIVLQHWYSHAENICGHVCVWQSLDTERNCTYRFRMERLYSLRVTSRSDCIKTDATPGLQPTPAITGI